MSSPTRTLDEVARRHVWWKPVGETLARRRDLAARIMARGDLEDTLALLSNYSIVELRTVLADPPTGVFDQPSWNYWHQKLGVTPMPPVPTIRSDLL